MLWNCGRALAATAYPGNVVDLPGTQISVQNIVRGGMSRPYLFLRAHNVPYTFHCTFVAME